MYIKPINFFALHFEVDHDTEKDERILVIAFTPFKNRFNHFHIEIRKKDIKKIYEYLGTLLEDAKTKSDSPQS